MSFLVVCLFRCCFLLVFVFLLVCVFWHGFFFILFYFIFYYYYFLMCGPWVSLLFDCFSFFFTDGLDVDVLFGFSVLWLVFLTSTSKYI